MKFLLFDMLDPDKAADVAKAGDKAWGSAPGQIKLLARYACLGLAFPGQPEGKAVVVDLVEADTSDAILGITYPVSLAGAEMWAVPVHELPVANVADFEKSIRG
jgi:hypothetical protein